MGERRVDRARAWVGACLAFLALALAVPTQAARVVDDRGVAVDLPQPPRRVISLLPSLGETVCALGACDRLVGVDNYASWPESVRRLPRLGGVEDADIERIVALKPDLVLLSSSSRAVARLQGLGIAVLGLNLKTLEDARRALVKVAQALDLPAASAAAAWARIDQGIESAARALPPSVRGTTVYFEVGSGYAASESSHIGQLLARLGVVNVVPGGIGSVPKLNPEFIVRADPKVIMMPAGDARPPAERPGWSHVSALRQGRVCAFDPAESDIVMRPGPRLDEAAAILARCLARQPAAGGRP
jgi:iron complex transport system substrate-binding protein